MLLFTSKQVSFKKRKCACFLFRKGQSILHILCVCVCVCVVDVIVLIVIYIFLIESYCEYFCIAQVIFGHFKDYHVMLARV